MTNASTSPGPSKARAASSVVLLTLAAGQFLMTLGAKIGAIIGRKRAFAIGCVI